MKVYAVERGSYSDYGIVAMFTTKALAEQAIGRMTNKYGDERVVAWDVFEAIPEPVTWYAKECNAGRVYEHEQVRDGWDAGPPYIGRVTRGLGFGRYGTGDRNYRFWGHDKAQVHKAFDDYHAQQEAVAAGVS